MKEPEWKIRMRLESQACWDRYQVLFLNRHVPMSDLQPRFEPPPDLYSKGKYCCPNCGHETLFRRGMCMHTCPECDWWYAYGDPVD